MQRRLPRVAGATSSGALGTPVTVAMPASFTRTRLAKLVEELGGASFGEGAYRVHAAKDLARWTSVAVAAFGELEGRIVVFASDWLGRLFALTTEPAPNGHPGVLLIDVFSGDVLHTDRDLDGFHDELLAKDPEPALSLELFDAWRAAGGAVPTAEQCVEYTIPLFLGGEPELSNMSVVDMKVAWHIAGQLQAQVRDMKPGTVITGINVSWRDKPGGPRT